MTGAEDAPPGVNGRRFYAHRLFQGQLDALVVEVERARRRDPEHDVRTNAAKRLAAVTRLAAGNPPDTWDRLMRQATANTHRLRRAVPPDDPDV